MAKTYAQQYNDSSATMYANFSVTGATIVSRSVVAFNKAVTVKAIPGPANTGGKIFIQRRKRIKAKDADTTAALGTQVVTRLNNASQLDWETVEMVTGKKRDFLVSVKPGDKANFLADPSQFKDGFENAMANKLIESEENAITEITTNTSVDQISLGDFSGTKWDLFGFAEALTSQLLLVKNDIAHKVDDFKHMSMVACHVHPLAGEAIRAFIGSAFQIDRAAWVDQVVPQFSTDNVMPGMVNQHFGKFTGFGTGSDETLVAIVIDDEAYFDSGYDKEVTPLDTRLLDIQWSGHSYWGASKLIDPSRVKFITAKLPETAVAKVNA